MAYDDKTVLDIVKAVDLKNIFEGEEERYKSDEAKNKRREGLIRAREIMKAHGKPSALNEQEFADLIGDDDVKLGGEIHFGKKAKLKESEIKELEKDIIAVKGGTYTKSEYFSDLRPQGKGTEKYMDYPSIKFKSVFISPICV